MDALPDECSQNVTLEIIHVWTLKTENHSSLLLQIQIMNVDIELHSYAIYFSKAKSYHYKVPAELRPRNISIVIFMSHY